MSDNVSSVQLKWIPPNERNQLYYNGLKPFYDERDDDPNYEDPVDQLIKKYATSGYLNVLSSYIHELLSRNNLPRSDEKTIHILRRFVEATKKENVNNIYYSVIEMSGWDVADPYILELLLEHKMIGPPDFKKFDVNNLTMFDSYVKITKLIFPHYINPNSIFEHTTPDCFFRSVSLENLKYLIKVGLDMYKHEIKHDIDYSQCDVDKLHLLSTYQPRCLFNRDFDANLPIRTVKSVSMLKKAFDQIESVLTTFISNECIPNISRAYLIISLYS